LRPAWLLAELKREDLPWHARHAEPVVSPEEMLHEWAAHGLMHTVQAERALMQPFIRAPVPGTYTHRSYRPAHSVKELISSAMEAGTWCWA
jgi:hypothetical protein